MLSVILALALLVTPAFSQSMLRAVLGQPTGGGGGGTFTLVQHTVSTPSCSDSQHCSATFTSTGAGHLLVLSAGYDSGSGYIDSASGAGTWTTSSSCFSAYYFLVTCAYNLNSSSGTTSISWTTSSGNFGAGQVTLLEFSRSAGSWALNGSITADGCPGGTLTCYATSFKSPDITLGGSNSVMISIIAGPAQTTISGGYSYDVTVPYGIGETTGTGYLLNTTTNTGPTWTSVVSYNATLVGLAFK